MARAARRLSEQINLSRRPALEGSETVMPWVTVRPSGPLSRLSLRAPEASVSALSKALGVTLPGKPKSSAEKAGRAVLWLGPDEWLVLDGAGNLASALQGVKQFHSAVDVSHRNVGIVVAGEGAEAALNAGCPGDLSLAAFPVGACSRTVLGKIEIVLWRKAEHEFHVECWRSFSDYAFAFLTEATRDAGQP
ncbi:sarcosine oxidase subunit gamma [Aquamicrobium sp. LC103]|uniref:sarcosine oxidase subunit gamma n=1 Tax=Aquamicrobium sp. LC103 TaxID=1120658 RepID=UPI00063E7FCD|nr:sarcosine oxidase subunit gamma [Aquamicrobium sp. LC103]TKT77577.1 sarcosine oxidase subunit gamma family protein [Aquamicrobium sp. LC103]